MRRRQLPQRGVTLIELAVMLVIVGLMLVLAIALIPKLTERARLDTTRDVTIADVRQALVSFAATNGRLPCPDTSAPANGLEGAGATAGCAAAPADVAGKVPYRALGFADPVLDAAHRPLRYAVYRNLSGGGSADADLATLNNRFIPVLPGDPAILGFPVASRARPRLTGSTDNLSQGLNPARKMPANLNDLDLCLALRNAKAAAANTAYVHSRDLGAATPPSNDAFVLVSGGVQDAGGSGTDVAFDGVNTGADTSYESPARRRGPGYDDIVYAMPFDLLASKLSCASITVGVSSAANTANAAALMVVQALDLLWLAQRNTAMDDIAVTQAQIALALATLQEIEIVSDGIRAGLNVACAPLDSEAPAVPEIITAATAGAAEIVLAGVSLDLANQQGALNNAVYTQTLSDALVVNDMAQRICVDAVRVDQRGGQGDVPPTPASPPGRL